MALPPASPPPKKSGFSPDIMQTLQKQNAPAKPMSPLQIIEADMQKTGNSNMSPKQVYAGLITASQSPKFRVARANNSLMTFSNEGNGAATAHLITADDPNTLIDSLKQFHQAMLKANFKKVQSTVTNPQMIRALEMAGIKVKQSMGQTMQGDQASPAINIVMEA